MNIDKFIVNMAEALEVDSSELRATTEFKDLASWDSLAALSVIAMIDESFNVSVGGDDLEKSTTLGDLWDLVAKRLG